MCGSSSTRDTIPAPAPSQIPNRHQVRNLIRKVARTMKKGDLTLDSYDFVSKCMVAGGIQDLRPWTEYDKARKVIDTAVKNSTFFTKQEGVCGSVKLTLRRTAVL